MRLKKKEVSSEALSQLIVQGMKEKKATDIIILDLKKTKNSIADFFVICSGSNENQLDAITDSIKEIVYKSTEQNPWHIEGKEFKEWILLDYVDVVAHVLKKDRRQFYELEDLWADAIITEIESEKIV